MEVTRITDAKPYEAPNHRDCEALRLQGWETSNTENFWVGFSTVNPGGGAGPDSTPFEKVYVVIEGQLSVSTSGNEITLQQYDSCRIAPGEVRIMTNKTDKPVKLIVIIAYPDNK